MFALYGVLRPCLPRGAIARCSHSAFVADSECSGISKLSVARDLNNIQPPAYIVKRLIRRGGKHVRRMGRSGSESAYPDNRCRKLQPRIPLPSAPVLYLPEVDKIRSHLPTSPICRLQYEVLNRICDFWRPSRRLCTDAPR